ncbi:hypothetical protein KJ733_02990 [Patescibacteria group bacterium]|nr:hypothetical protein [Patescibacteria group bacterium]
MNLSEANRIFNDFKKIAAKTEHYVARPLSLLSYSKGKIKYAFFVYVEDAIKHDQLTSAQVSEL